MCSEGEKDLTFLLRSDNVFVRHEEFCSGIFGFVTAS